MGRDLTLGIKNAIDAENSETIYFVQCNFYNLSTEQEDLLCLSTGSNDMDWDGKTWTAIGGNLQFSSIEESIDLSANGVDWSLCDVQKTIIPILLNKLFIGRDIITYLVKISLATRTIIIDPKMIFKGKMNGEFNVLDKEGDRNTPGSTTISCRAVGKLSDLDKVSSVQTNVSSHQRWYYGDTFFRYVENTMYEKVNWASE